MIFKHHKGKLYVLGKAQALYQPKDTDGLRREGTTFKHYIPRGDQYFVLPLCWKQVHNSRQISTASQVLVVVAELATITSPDSKTDYNIG